jgi:hypothetical protein
MIHTVQKTILWVLFSLSIAVPLVAMEGNGTIAVYEGREKMICDVINDVKEGGSICLQTPFFSSKPIQNALIKASTKRAIDIVVHFASRAKADQDKLKKAGIKVKVLQGLHAKRLLCKDKVVDKIEGDGEDAVIHYKDRFAAILGSDNMTTFSKFHREMLLKKTGDADYYEEHRQEFDNAEVPAVISKELVGDTPKKAHVVSSRTHNLNASKGKRLETLLTDPDSANSADITSMTFDSNEFVASIERVFAGTSVDKHPTLRLFLDKDALRHTDLLNRIKVAGGDKAKIYIFNEDKKRKIFNKFPQLQHSKTLIRCGSKRSKLSIVSTGNLADRSDTDLNYDSYHPNDEFLYDAIHTANDKLVDECTEYKLPVIADTTTTTTS